MEQEIDNEKVKQNLQELFEKLTEFFQERGEEIVKMVKVVNEVFVNFIKQLSRFLSKFVYSFMVVKATLYCKSVKNTKIPKTRLVRLYLRTNLL